jgi:osmotically-inducible protein OsmY
MRTSQARRRAGFLGNSVFSFAGLVLAGALHASAAEPSAGDVRLRRAVEDAVRTNPYLGVFDHVVADVQDGRVHLQGSVELPHRRQAAAARVAKLPGVLEVTNDIQVQSAAPADRQRRRRLFERLYYGGGIPGSSEPEWPVRILVSDGGVTLAGFVPSGPDRERLMLLAADAGATFVESQLQVRDSSVRLAAAQE